jgi:hypothetical protein
MSIPLLGLVAAAVVGTFLAPVLARAVEDFLTIDRALVSVDNEDEEIAALLKAHGIIPKDGSGGAFGYGILTEAGLNGVIVTTTHAGVKDSELQEDASDPVFHNHYLKLETGLSGLCQGPEVADLTFESPGDVNVAHKFVFMRDLPFSFSGTSALTNEPLTITPGGNIDDVVSFTLEPKFDDDGNLAAVCVNDIMSAKHLKVFDNERLTPGLPPLTLPLDTDATGQEGAAAADNGEEDNNATTAEESIPDAGSEGEG